MTRLASWTLLVGALGAVALARPASGDGAIRLRARTVQLAERDRLTAASDSPDGQWLVAVTGRVTASIRADLADAGARVEAYVPDDALLVHAAPQALAALRAKPYVRAVLPLATADRLSPRLARPSWPDEPALAGLLTVQLAPGEDALAFAARAAPAGGTLVAVRAGGTYPRFVWRVEPGRERDRAEALAALPGVLWVEPAGLVRWLNDTSVWVGQSWDTTTFATPVFAHGLFGAGQVVGISDTGLDADHACFYDATQGLPTAALNPLQRKVIAYHDRLLTGDWDNNGHGTHTAGTIAGDLNGNGRWDANGPAQAPDGMAPGAKLAVSDANDTCLPGNPIDLRELFQQTYDDGARIHSDSWASCDCDEYTVHSQDVDDFMWATRDMAVFFAAGNAGAGPATVLSPGTAKDCVTVGATQRAAAADSLAGFSSRGPTDDGRLKPTVTAPGVSIRSAHGDGNIASFNDDVVALSGTSMATPTTAGLATLVREYLVKGFYPTGAARAADAIPDPSAALIKAMLVNSARNMANEATAPSNQQGWGRVLLDDVLHFAGDRRGLVLVDETRGLAAPGEKRTFPIVVGGAPEALKVTLVWTDPPAATLVGPKLVNDLDLVVAGPGGTFLGNNFAGGVSQPGGVADRLNVEEGVRLPTPAPGMWTVTIAAANVPFGPQPYALVVTGDVAPGPHLGLRSFALADPKGNGNGLADPGELVEVGVTLGEDGGAPATGIRVTLAALVPWAKVVSAATQAFPDAPARGTTASPAPWLVALDPAAPCGEMLVLGLAVASDQGSFDDGFAAPTGPGSVATTTLLADSFDALAPGDPPSPLDWTTGFAVAPAAGVQLRVEADATVEPPGTAASSPPNALYVGRSAGGTNPTQTFLRTNVFDLSSFDRATFRFRYWVRSLEGGIPTADHLFVQASADGGATFPVSLYTNPDYASGMDSSSYPDKRWHDVVVDLDRAGLLAPAVTIRFLVVVNADEPGDAVYLDDVRLDGERVTCDPGCVPPAYVPAAPAPVCAGDATRFGATVLARGFRTFDGAWSFGDTAAQPVAALDDPVAHVYAAAGAYTASLDAVERGSPACRRSESVAVDVDGADSLAVPPAVVVCTSSPTATVWATRTAPGHGPFSWAWDFGDGSAPVPVADPTSPVAHAYPAAPGSYTARLSATDSRLPACVASHDVRVDVVNSLAPTGRIGNALFAIRVGVGIRLDWRTARLLPRTYNAHRTARKDRLVQTPSVLGAEPIVAAPVSEAATDVPPAAGPGALWYYQVAGRDACTGKSVLP